MATIKISIIAEKDLGGIPALGSPQFYVGALVPDTIRDSETIRVVARMRTGNILK